MKLAGPDHWTWLGLRRVNCGSVARFQGRYYDGGRLIPGCLYEYLFDGLIGEGLLDVTDPDEDGMARVTLSDAGRTEYRALCKRQRQRRAR
ncbi:MAG: hypothetical protein ABR608_12465 [Pseudonocardiaceae bacterium]